MKKEDSFLKLQYPIFIKGKRYRMEITLVRTIHNRLSDFNHDEIVTEILKIKDKNFNCFELENHFCKFLKKMDNLKEICVWENG